MKIPLGEKMDKRDLFPNRAEKSFFDFTGAAPEEILKSVFGYDSFRSLQKEVITNVLSGRDTLAVMPTGGGKSLCYQIPALIFKGLTVVVSPLIALMEDQVSSLVENGVHAVFLNSSLEWTAYCDALNAVKSGDVKIVYVSPEGLATQRIQNLLHDDNVTVNCITIDEAHCISEWGHDFRPDYLEIASIRKQFRDAVCLALTATATKQVRKDIVEHLEMKNPEIIMASFNRPNIFLEVQRKTTAFTQTVECIQRYPGESGIIYCFSRRQVDSLTKNLLERGFSVLNYHAGLSDEQRSDHQRRFIRDEVQIMVATVAFGMGIDKPNVRYVIHYDLPKSLEQYYQEIGRAGRDGLPSTALLLYSPADIFKIRYFINESDNSEKEERLLQGMIDYATCRTCRRHFLLAYFGETLPLSDPAVAYSILSGTQNSERNPLSNGTPECPRMPCCDICESGPVPETDVTIPVQKLLSCILRTRERFGASYIIDVLLGSRQKRIVDNGHNMISTWGIGTELCRDDWFLLTECLIESGYVSKTADYNVLHVTHEGRCILSSRETVKMPVAFRKAPAEQQSEGQLPPHNGNKKKSFIVHKAIDPDDTEALRISSKLKEWRKQTASEENVPPYVIMGDKTIIDIAVKKPKTYNDLLTVYGIGRVKADKFGSSILRIVGNDLIR